MNSKLRLLFYPISLLYLLISTVRNILFNVNIFKKCQPSLFTINVGNIQVGGTGKTPHVSYLVKLFKNKNQTILSRGYGRKTKGLVWATSDSTANDIGDEPLQLYKSHKIEVVVSEKRVRGIHEIIQKDTSDIIILDDAFQHRFVTPHLNLILTTFNEPFYNDYLLPAGNLRESKFNVKRADAIIITKCNKNILKQDKDLIISKLSKYKKNNVPVFFSYFEYKKPCGFSENNFNIDKDIVIISGIAKPKYFVDYCETNFKCSIKYSFKDHHNFTKKELLEIIENNGNVQYLTTEKDFVKIESFLDENQKKLFYYLPIEVVFLDSNGFDSFVLNSYKNFENVLK